MTRQSQIRARRRSASSRRIAKGDRNEGADHRPGRGRDRIDVNRYRPAQGGAHSRAAANAHTTRRVSAATETPAGRSTPPLRCARAYGRPG